MKTGYGRAWLGATTMLGVAVAAGNVTAAQAQDVGGDPSLAAQVKALSALVQSVEERDLRQIQALKDQVDALQAQVARQAAPSAYAANPQTAAGLPRALQNSSGLGGTGAASYAAETPDASQAQPRIVQNSAHRLSLQSADGQYTIGLLGMVQFDSGDYVSFRPDSKVVGPQDLSNGVNSRRARIGFAGAAFGNFGFAFVYDAGNSSDATQRGIETAQVVYTGLKGAAVELGYSNTFFTLDQSTGSGDLLFLERASPSNIATNFNTGDNRANAGVRFFGDRYWLGGYVTGPATGDSHTLTAERLGAFERGAFQVLKGSDYNLHLGFGVSELLQAPNAGNGTPDTLSLSDQPELRIDPTTLLNTGTIGATGHPVTGGQVYDLETAAEWKSLLWQGEVYKYDVQRRDLPDLDFGGLYGQVAWTITGEHHLYNPQAASYFRISPAHPFSLQDGNWGAWEIAARVSYVDLDDRFQGGLALAAQPAAVDGGRQTGYTLGLNWYPNDLFRFMLDYDHIDYSKTNATAVTGAALGVPVGTQLDAISLRAQVAF